MKLTASVVPYSSVVGSSIKMCDETGKVVALLIISIPNPEFEYKATAQIVADNVMWRRLAKRPVAFRIKNAVGTWPYYVEKSYNDSFVFVDAGSTNFSGDPLRIPIKQIVGTTSGRVKTFYYAATSDTADIIWRRQSDG